ncbi:hypothetical protein K501DRAFT_331372 [Backusella circina FSU 941]|nr:hypothetical protein K501DRAFT_331372 [Backusella circina FSU 941]
MRLGRTIVLEPPSNSSVNVGDAPPVDCVKSTDGRELPRKEPNEGALEDRLGWDALLLCPLLTDKKDCPSGGMGMFALDNDNLLRSRLMVFIIKKKKEASQLHYFFLVTKTTGREALLPRAHCITLFYHREKERLEVRVLNENVRLFFNLSTRTKRLLLFVLLRRLYKLFRPLLTRLSSVPRDPSAESRDVPSAIRSHSRTRMRELFTENFHRVKRRVNLVIGSRRRPRGPYHDLKYLTAGRSVTLGFLGSELLQVYSLNYISNNFVVGVVNLTVGLLHVDNGRRNCLVWYGGVTIRSSHWKTLVELGTRTTTTVVVLTVHVTVHANVKTLTSFLAPTMLSLNYRRVGGLLNGYVPQVLMEGAPGNSSIVIVKLMLGCTITVNFRRTKVST